MNLASVSKSVTAVAVLKLLSDKELSVHDKFYPIVQNQFPAHGQGVDTVRIRDLLTMKSGMVVDGTLNPPDIPPAATLAYSNATDNRNGQYWGPLSCVAAGGWISSPNELMKFLAGVRNNVALSAQTTRMMFDDNLGWYTYDGLYGQYDLAGSDALELLSAA